MIIALGARKSGQNRHHFRKIYLPDLLLRGDSSDSSDKTAAVEVGARSLQMSRGLTANPAPRPAPGPAPQLATSQNGKAVRPSVQRGSGGQCCGLAYRPGAQLERLGTTAHRSSSSSARSSASSCFATSDGPGGSTDACATTVIGSAAASTDAVQEARGQVSAGY